ncbi:hypothetical protein PP7435_CHR1-0763 [Komagataella phaffii CBS 7435]|uniref:Thiamine-binding protein domain-containing protein n=2 Tax=Komagataella phaffii TaxID=460519 RepID=C4QX49_KOMPG|nr:Non-essential protein of unknown function, likely exists as tetrame [Komagataella phaffii GS115]CAH2446622.1 Hypothetical protein BQ9382_C1-3970 [Komagataella phaffii CBS 7435]CAY67822.1 Non-essential protein of unknown function, likely exists as tetrame [Komagataella phaffii GS115]CCA36904.1 hypothetical protein PP7435_CHR1-0763 [Komagataella phaffii CBS 7435]
MPHLNCIADICLIPIGTGSPSVSNEITIIERHIRSSHLRSTLHSAGTTIEGPWDEVMVLIGELHELLHSLGVHRIQSDIRVGTRDDKAQTAKDKVDVVEKKLEDMPCDNRS